MTDTIKPPLPRRSKTFLHNMNFSSKTHKNCRTWPPLPPKKSPNPPISQQTHAKMVAEIGELQPRSGWRRASKFFFKIIIFVTLSTLRLPNPRNEEQDLEIKIKPTKMNIKPTNLQPRKKQQHRDETTNPLRWTTYIYNPQAAPQFCLSSTSPETINHHCPITQRGKL